MWEKDRKMLGAFKECYKNMIQSINEGEEVDFSSTCVEETEALAAYTISHITYYKETKPQEVNFRRVGFYNPKLPYFQNF